MNQHDIEQYLAGKMGQAEAEAFEEFCLDHPEFARQVEFEQRLKIGLAEVARGSTSEFIRSNHSPRWMWAAAAAVVLALGAGYWFWHAPSGKHALLASLSSESAPVGATLRLAMVRGADTSPTLPDSGLVRVEIVGLFDTDVHYSISLERLTAQKPIDTLGTLYGQHAVSPMSLDLVLDSDQLPPGTYSLRVRKLSSDDEALDFSFVKN